MRVPQGLRQFAADESGATAIEYGLMAALIAVGALMALTLFGGSVNQMFATVSARATSTMDDAGVEAGGMQSNG